ncbi:hypothetical protein HK097_005993, partial [Rhizophlyctis rosea]
MDVAGGPGGAEGTGVSAGHGVDTVMKDAEGAVSGLRQPDVATTTPGMRVLGLEALELAMPLAPKGSLEPPVIVHRRMARSPTPKLAIAPKPPARTLFNSGVSGLSVGPDKPIDPLAVVKRKVGRPKGSTKKSRSPSSTEVDETKSPAGTSARLKPGRRRGSGNPLSINTTVPTTATVIPPSQQMEMTGYRWLEGFREGDVVWTCWSPDGGPRMKLWPCLVVRRVECTVGEDGMEALRRVAESLGIDLGSLRKEEGKEKGDEEKNGLVGSEVVSGVAQGAVQGGCRKSLEGEGADPIEEVLNVEDETEILKAVGMGRRRRSSLQWRNKSQNEEGGDSVGSTPVKQLSATTVIASPRKADFKWTDSEGIESWDVLPVSGNVGPAKWDVPPSLFQDVIVPETDGDSDGVDDIDVVGIGSEFGTSGIELEPISSDTSSPIALPDDTSTRKMQALLSAYRRTDSTTTQHYVLRPLPLSPTALLPTKCLEKDSWHKCLFRSAEEVLPYSAHEPGVDVGVSETTALEEIDLKNIVLENR